jgi:hypothetical protein
MQAQANMLAVRDYAANILHLVGKYVRRRHLDGSGQIDDGSLTALRLPNV